MERRLTGSSIAGIQESRTAFRNLELINMSNSLYLTRKYVSPASNSKLIHSGEVRDVVFAGRIRLQLRGSGSREL
jgi:hypothetical protein